MAQFGRPSSVIAAGQASATGAATLWECVDEVTSNGDTDYVFDGSGGISWTLTLSTVNDPVVHTGHIVRAVAKQGGGGGSTIKVELLQGASTVIAATGFVNVTASYATYGMTLTSGEAAAITNYADLRVRITNQNTLAGVRTTQIELEVPSITLSATIGQATETDTAQAMTRRKARTAGQASETDTAQPMGRSKSKTIGMIVETSTAQPFARSKSRSVGQASETDLAQPLARSKSKAIGVAEETDLAQPVTRSKARTTGQASETNLAQPVARSKARTLGQVEETGTAQPVTRSKALSIGQASEMNVAQPLTRAKLRTLGLVTEADLAQSFTRRKLLRIGQVGELDRAIGFDQLDAAVGTQLPTSVGIVAHTALADILPAAGLVTVVEHRMLTLTITRRTTRVDVNYG